MALSAEERARIRRALGFVNVTEGSALAYGTPLNAPLLTIVERRMDTLTAAGETLIREDLGHFEAARRQIGTAILRLKAESIKDVTTNPKELDQLKEQLLWWSRQIADNLGIDRSRFAWVGEANGGINARVVR